MKFLFINLIISFMNDILIKRYRMIFWNDGYLIQIINKENFIQFILFWIIIIK